MAGVISMLNLPINITGNAISTAINSGKLFFGFVFIIVGLALLLVHQEGQLEKNLAQKIKESGRVIDKPKELIHIAREMEYRLGKQVKEGVPIYDLDGNYITVIPIHKVTWRTSRDIINELAKGKTSLNRRNYS